MNAKNIGLIIAVVAIGGAIFYFQSLRPERVSIEQEVEPLNLETKEEKARKYPIAREIVKPSGFVNTDGITIQELIGKKVILVDFWTYSCINCQRTLPFLTSWYEKYKDQGLEIIGMHTPEFKFEEEIANVRTAVKQYDVEYPVVLDNDYATWNNYANRYWPRKYIIDIDGFIVYDHIGEGAYDETEKKIQELLKERMQVLGESGDIEGGIVSPEGVQTPERGKVGSPEIYFGAWRNTHFGNGKAEQTGSQTLSEPDEIKTNLFYLVGDWDIMHQHIENTSEDAKIIFRYNAKDVYMVASSEKPVHLEIFQDDELFREVTVQPDQLYKLIEDESYGEHTMEIRIKEEGLKAFTFTFG